MLQIFCFLCTWTLIVLLIRNIYKTSKEGVDYVKRLHQIPCARCAFFTGDYRLKCTVRPSEALTEDAVDCLDFEPTSYPHPTVPACCQVKKF